LHGIETFFIMKKYIIKICLLSILVVFINHESFSQGVGINNTGTPADPSALLDVSSNSKGVLFPRMTTAKRDSIVLPVQGLIIYNTTTNCLNYFNGSAWMELCGDCIPLPTTANAGVDQLNINGVTTTLAGNVPTSGTGVWSIIAGTGGSISDPSDPVSSFTGLAGNSYTLSWAITTPCSTSYDTVNVSFSSVITPLGACPSGKKFLFVGGKDNLGGNTGTSIVQLSSNCNIIAAGYTSNYGAGSSDWLIVDIDTSGNYVWSKTIGGTGADGTPYIDTTHDGGYVIAGSVFSWLHSNSDVLLVKFDASHNIVFSKVLGSATYSEDVSALSLAPDNGFYVLCKASAGSATHGVLIKFNASGVQQWVKLIAINPAEPTFFTDTYRDVKATPDGGCIVVGDTWTYRMTGAYNQCMVQKYSSTGVLEWARVYGQTDPPYNTLGGYGVDNTTDGGYIVSGYPGSANSFLFKLSATGDVLWAKNTTTGMFSKVITCYDGGFFVSAISAYFQVHNSRTFYKFDIGGNLEWVKTDNVADGHPNPFDYYGDVFQVHDGFLTAAGTHKHTNAYGLTNLCVEKFKFDGTTCYSNSVTTSMAAVTLVTADVTAAVQTNLQNLTVSTSSPVVTPVLQNIDHWTDCSQ